jgi:hypothetical protein
VSILDPTTACHSLDCGGSTIHHLVVLGLELGQCIVLCPQCVNLRNMSKVEINDCKSLLTESRFCRCCSSEIKVASEPNPCFRDRLTLQTRQKRLPVIPMCEHSSLCIGLSPGRPYIQGTSKTSSSREQSQASTPSA